MWVLFPLLLSSLAFQSSFAKVKISATLGKKLADTGVASVLISIGQSPLAICDRAARHPLKAASPQGTLELIRKLKAHAALTQRPVIAALNALGVWNLKTFWITNVVYVPSCHATAISALATHEAVSGIDEERHFVLDPIPGDNVTSTTPKSVTSWGIDSIRAPEVWKKGITGQGVIVGHIDTGVRWTHQDLRGSYLGLWYDPDQLTAQPNDQVGHGTHTLGTIVGANGIGVAPGAKWLSCKGCQNDTCSQSDLLACGQWVVCPDGEANGCQKKPHVVSNSWGSQGMDSFYQSVVLCWRAMNIFGVFANGNSGPNCGTSGSPARYSIVVSVGALDINDNLADFSSRSLMPTSAVGFPLLQFKPDVSAPGVDITSSWMSDDNAYATGSGTSMATPHVAGIVALILSACSKPQTYSDIKKQLVNGCRQATLIHPVTVCEEVNANLSQPMKFPNNEFGMGAVDAFNSVTVAQQNGGGCGTSTWKFEDFRNMQTGMPPGDKFWGLTFPSLLKMSRDPNFSRSVKQALSFTIPILPNNRFKSYRK